MDLFFEARLEGYEEHMLNNIEGAREFYPFTASQLPQGHILDLGCGTGLELNWYFQRHPTGKVTGIDLSAGMLSQLLRKFPDQEVTLIQGSYFDADLGEHAFDGAISVESLHHFTKEEKIPLYRKLCSALKPGAAFILTDYFAPDETCEVFHRAELLRLKAEAGIPEGDFYHYDTPLTVEHDIEARTTAGFAKIETLGCWGATCCLRALK